MGGDDDQYQLNSRLCTACQEGHVEEARALVEKGADVTYLDSYPLFRAAENGHVEIIQLMIDLGANINALSGVPEETLLHAAAEYGQVTMVTFLLEKGLDPDAVNRNGESVLHKAAESGNIDVMQLLLDHGADLHKISHGGLSILGAGVRSGKIEVLKFLAGKGLVIATDNENGFLNFWFAVSYGTVEMVQFLLANGAGLHYVDSRGCTALNAAVLSQNFEVAKFLVDCGADVNAQDEDSGLGPLYLAAMHCNIEMVQYLVQRGADIHAVTKDGHTALHIAAAADENLQIIQLLLDHGLDINVQDKNGEGALYKAALSGSLKKVQYFVDQGADLHAVTKTGRTILHSAAAGNDDLGVLKFLVEHGLDVNAQDEDGIRPLYDAAGSRRVPILYNLISMGSDIHAVTKSGRTPLHNAVNGGNYRAVKFLIDRGLDINAQDEDGHGVLYEAASKQDGYITQLLIDLGANINVVTKRKETILHAAAECEDTAIMKMLIQRGVAVDSVDEDHYSVLHSAARSGNVENIKTLIEHGASIHAVTEKLQRTVLHEAALSGSKEAVRFLVEQGLSVDAIDSSGSTMLHEAARAGNIETMQLLVDLGADIHAVRRDGRSIVEECVRSNSQKALQCLQKRGIDIDERDENDRTLLHRAALAGSDYDMRFLVNCGANARALTRAGESILHFAIESDRIVALACAMSFDLDINQSKQLLDLVCSRPMSKDSYRMALLLCSHGYAGDQDNDAFGEAEGAQDNANAIEDREKLNEDTSANYRKWSMGLRACIRHWTTKQKSGSSLLTDVPLEVVARGPDSVASFLADVARSTQDELLHRCKVCMVGPSLSGKTSLTQSVSSMKSFLAKLRDRTIGIDLTTCLLDGARAVDDDSENVKLEMTMWDFAGQDEYHAAHTLFFSRRTLFILVIDMEAYAKQVLMARTKPARQAESLLRHFARANIFRWLRLIFAHRPDAHFLVVGTKANLLEDAKLVNVIWNDFQDRLDEWRSEYLKELDQQARHTGGDSRVVDELKSKLSQIEVQNLISADVTSIESIADFRKVLQHTITSCGVGFPMWRIYGQVVRAVARRRERARTSGSESDRVDRSIVGFKNLRRQLMEEIEDLTRGDCEQILRTLHDLGDVLWYEHEDAGELQHYIILDPKLVIDIVREVIRHDFSSRTDGVWPVDGRISHDLLTSFALWRTMDEDLVHAFKALLQHFQLAYPADDDTMQLHSDLIVPSYWKASDHAASPHNLAPSGSEGGKMLLHWWCWEYAVPSELSETIFEQFAVASHSSLVKRKIHGFNLETLSTEFSTKISLMSGNSSRDVIRVETSGETSDLSWHAMRFYLMKLEKVLETYVGDTVGRWILYRPNNSIENSEARHSVDPLVHALRDAYAMSQNINSVRKEMPWMPPDMDWFLNKSWNKNIVEFQQLQMSAYIHESLEALKRLVTTDGSRRQYPALWSLVYDPFEKKAFVRMMSDVSGRCFHAPLEINVGSPILAHHAELFKEGLSLCSTLLGNALSLPIIERALEVAKSSLDSKIDRTKNVHILIEKLDVASSQHFDTRSTTLPPTVSINVLRDLLKAYNDSMDVVEISELANLKCAVTKRGEYVWAHAHEIKTLAGELTECSVPPSLWKSLEISHPSSSLSASFSGLSTTKEEAPFLVSIVLDSVKGLSDWDWRKTYCTWQLYFDGLGGHSGSALARGATPTNSDSGSPPSWRTLSTAIDAVASVEMLRACRLTVQVKRRSRMFGTKSLGEGDVFLGDVVPEGPVNVWHSSPIEIILKASSSEPRSVIVQLTVST